jgi:Fe-S-cluster-containing dehydrogenase component
MKRSLTRNIMLHYPKELTEKPVISNLVKKFDLTVNISSARIGQDEEGTMVIEVSGIQENLDSGLQYLRQIGVTFKPVSKIITRIDEKCTHCSACTVICPTDALTIENRTTMFISFHEKRCIACGLCIPACPYRAMAMDMAMNM